MKYIITYTYKDRETTEITATYFGFETLTQAFDVYNLLKKEDNTIGIKSYEIASELNLELLQNAIKETK